MTPFDTSRKEAFENIVGKVEIACTSISTFPTMFSTLLMIEIIIFVHLICRLQMPSIWSGQKFCCVGMG